MFLSKLISINLYYLNKIMADFININIKQGGFFRLVKKLKLSFSISNKSFFIKVFILLFFTISCHKPPFYGEEIIEPKINIENNWYNKSFVTLDLESEKKWWLKYNNKTLNLIIELATKNNHSLSSIHSKIREARAEANIKKANLLPNVDAGSSFTRSSDNFNPINPNNKNIYNFYRSSLDVSWEIDIFGSNFNQKKFKDLVYLSVIEEKNYLLQSLIAEIITIFVEIDYLKKDLTLTNLIANYHRKKLELAQERKRVGLENQIQINEIEQDLIDAKFKISSVKRDIDNKIYKIEFLSSQNIGSLRQKILRSKNLSNINNFNFIVDLPLAIIDNRPDVKMASYQYLSSIANKNYMAAQIFPKLSLSSFIGFSNTQSGNLFKTNSRFFGNSASIQMPLINFGKVKQGVVVADEIKKQSYINLKEKIDNVLLEVEVAMNDIVKYQDQINLLNKKYQKISENTQLRKQIYDAGLISYGNFIDDKIKLLKSCQEINNNSKMNNLAIIAFYKSIGL